MNKKISIILVIVIIIIAIVGSSAYLFSNNDEELENSTKTNVTNTTNNTTTDNSSIKSESVEYSETNENNHNGLKYSSEYGVWYDPNDPETWYDENGYWQKMEPDLTKEFMYEHSSEDDVFYNSYGQQVSKEEYFNDPNIRWA